MRIYYEPYLKELARKLRNNMTKSEVRLWQYLKRDQLHGYDFHRQKPIDRYIVDFFCNKLRLAIECDRSSHQIVEVFQKDTKKTKRLNQLGIHVLRFSDWQILNDTENVIRAIEAYIIDFEENGYKPPSVPA